jgi:fatty acid desaturase
MLKTLPASRTFSIRQARAIVKDLFEPNPVLYWVDFLASMTIGVASTLVALAMLRGRFELSLPWNVLVWTCSYCVSVVAYYRGVLFIHELVHLRTGTFGKFRMAWNMLCGIPMLLPSFLYYKHLDHHSARHYAGEEDGEYLPLGVESPRHILGYLAQSLIIPALAVLRFLVMTPLSWVIPGVRTWVQRRASSMIIDPSYVRPAPNEQELHVWKVQETLCFLWCAGMAAMFIGGIIPWIWLAHIYAVAVGAVTLNAVRTLGAHRYRFRGDEELTFIEQLLDSVNYPRWAAIGELWAPVGLRFHALHHLFPSMPYHNLAKAHHRLIQQLPAGSVYHETVSPGLWHTLSELWQHARRSGQVDQEPRHVEEDSEPWRRSA